MSKLIMLGTGCGFNDYFYNTCFVINHNNKNFLIDAGGSQKIYYRLLEKNIKLTDIHDIFISHAHTDHVLGLIWLLKKMCSMFGKKYTGKLNIYCNQFVCDAIKSIYHYTIAERHHEKLEKNINFIIVKPGDKLNIIGLDFSFFDSFDEGNNLTCFETDIDGKSLVFLGDTPCDNRNYEFVKNKDYVMHEAFCLDKDADIFNPYEKHHSTVKSTCESLKDFNIKNLILYHTIDDYEDSRKEKYINEAKMSNYTGNVIVPEDMEEILI